MVFNKVWRDLNGEETFSVGSFVEITHRYNKYGDTTEDDTESIGEIIVNNLIDEDVHVSIVLDTDEFNDENTSRADGGARAWDVEISSPKPDRLSFDLAGKASETVQYEWRLISKFSELAHKPFNVALTINATVSLQARSVKTDEHITKINKTPR